MMKISRGVKPTTEWTKKAAEFSGASIRDGKTRLYPERRPSMRSF